MCIRQPRSPRFGRRLTRPYQHLVEDSTQGEGNHARMSSPVVLSVPLYLCLAARCISRAVPTPTIAAAKPIPPAMITSTPRDSASEANSAIHTGHDVPFIGNREVLQNLHCVLHRLPIRRRPHYDGYKWSFSHA